MKGDTISRQALLNKFADRARAAKNWKENAINNGNEEITIRADATLNFLTEVKLTIESAPTIENTPRICQAPSIYHEPMENNYIKAIDNGAQMLECPKCKGRIVANPFTYAVGTAGYAFCPYCGHDLRKGGQP